MTTSQQIEGFERRLHTLERSAIRWRRVATLAVILASGVGLLGAVKNAARVVEVQGIRFVDADGKDRGFVGVDADNQSTLLLKEADGDGSVVSLQIVDGQPILSLQGRNNESVAAVKADEFGGTIGLQGIGGTKIIGGFSKGEGGIQMLDQEDNRLIYFGSDGEANNQSQLQLRDSSGNLRFAITADNNRTLMMLADFKEGLREAVLETAPGKGGSFGLYDAEGKPYFLQEPPDGQ